jgi:hypothetical protein
LVICHFGFNKTMELVFQNYWWPQLWKYVKEFVKSCDVCVHVKNFHCCHHGLLQQFLIPSSRMVFISHGLHHNLPPSSSYDSILVVVDHLMKMVHFILCTKKIHIIKICLKIFHPIHRLMLIGSQYIIEKYLTFV